MQIKCDDCGKRYEIPERHVGKKFDCQKCGTVVRSDSALGQRIESFENTPVLDPATSSPAPVAPCQPTRLTGGLAKWSVIGALAAGIAIVGTCYFGIQFLNSNNNKTVVAETIVPNTQRVGEGTGLAQPEVEQENVAAVAAAIDPRKTAQFFSTSRPMLETDIHVDPTRINFMPKYFELMGLPKNSTIPIGLSYGGPWFLDIYSKGMRSDSATVAFDSAIAAANWGHERELALTTILSNIRHDEIVGQSHVERRAYALRILNTYSQDELNAAFIESLSSGNESGHPFIVDVMNEYNWFTPELIKAAKRGHAIKQRRKRQRGAFTDFQGFSSSRYSGYLATQPLHLKNINLAPGSNQSPFAIWTQATNDTSFAADYGLDRVPPMMNILHHANMREWHSFGTAHMSDEESESLTRFLKELNILISDVEFLTLGYVESDAIQKWQNAIHQWQTPRVMVVRIRQPRFQKPEFKNKSWQLSGGNVAQVADADTIVLGTENEVQWAIERGGNDYVHPAAYQWLEIKNSCFFRLKFDEGSFHTLFDQGKSFRCDQVKSLLTTPPGSRNRTIERTKKRAASQKKDLEGTLGFPDNSTVEVIEKKDRVAIRTTCLREKVRPNLSTLVLLDFVHKSFLPEQKELDLPKNEEAWLQHGAHWSFPDLTDDHRLVITKLLSYIQSQLDVNPNGVPAKDATQFLKSIYQIRKWCAAEHVAPILKIGSSIQFENEGERASWMVACLAPQRDPTAVKEMHRMLQNEQVRTAFNLETSDGEKLDPHEQYRREIRIQTALDEFGPNIEYLLRFGSENMQLRCIELAKWVPVLRRGLRFRLAMVSGEKHSARLSEALQEFAPPEKLKFKIPNVETPGESFSGNHGFYTYKRDILELPTAGPKPKFVSNKLFSHTASPFEIKVPEFAERITNPDLFGRLVHIQKRDNETVQEWSRRSDASRTKTADDFDLIDGFRLQIENSDGMTVDFLVRSVDEIKRRWDLENVLLGKQLVAERQGDSGADFDRIRLFFIGKTPKAQRIIAYRDREPDDETHNKVGVRWIGRSSSAHPDYVTEIMNSLKIHRD